MVQVLARNMFLHDILLPLFLSLDVFRFLFCLLFFSALFAKENCPTILAASFFRQTAELTLHVLRFGTVSFDLGETQQLCVLIPASAFHAFAEPDKTEESPLDLFLHRKFFFKKVSRLQRVLSQATACDGVYYQIPAGVNTPNLPPGVLPI